MQKHVSKIVIILSIASYLSAFAAPSTFGLKRADSLYTTKQYTQAFEIYKTVFDMKEYSPSMLLKMAYIQEGLGHLGESLYYLNLYFLVSDDSQALKKMEELAQKNNLEGYETDGPIKLFAWLREQYTTLNIAIASAALFLMALVFYQRMKRKTRPMAAAILLLLVLSLLFVHNNFNLSAERGIVANPQTYLMSGPSSGASVIAIIGEGHQLKIKGKKDVWLKVDWHQQEVFVRENNLRAVRL